LFEEDGSPADRPVILEAPDEIHHGEDFEIQVQGMSSRIASIAIIRSDHNTHSFVGGDRFVDLGFSIKGPPQQGGLKVRTPGLPAQAVPGIYMLFVVDKDGVPSMAKRVDLVQD
jgi:hypothetical protein